MIKDVIDNCISSNLVRLRHEHGLTQNDLVARMQTYDSNMTRSFYSLIELGRRYISVADLYILKNIYNVEFEEFFKDFDMNEALDK